MKAILMFSTSALLLAGCASSEKGHVYYNQDGTKVYGLDQQPQSAVVGEGTLMPGAYASHDMQTGQFTGKERSQDFVGANPVTPREADPRDFSRASQPTTAIVPPAGAGTLGQTGVQPRTSLSTSTLMSGPSNPSLAPSAGATANPPTAATAPTLSQPLTSGANNIDSTTGVGGLSGIQSSSGRLNANSLPSTKAPTITPTPGQESTITSATTDLTERVRNALTTGRPDSITHLTPERLQDFDIEAVNGNVTLRGTARSETEKLMIGNKIARIEGVRSVNNQLRVISPSRQETGDVSSPSDRANPLHQEK
jgi:hypothetical protein